MKTKRQYPSRRVPRARLTCVQCGKTFEVYMQRKDTARFCSKKCANLGQRSLERRRIKCKTCGKRFETKADHGVWPKYCSRACFLAPCVRSEQRACEQCGVTFKATRSTGTGNLMRFCGHQCAGRAARKPVVIECPTCGVAFEARAGGQRQKSRGYCSLECRQKGIRGDANANWQGGNYIWAETGFRYVMTCTGYILEHRLVAEKIMGRYLDYHSEPILHLNGEPADNRPKNLFICESMSEMRRRINGDLPWPTKSNLSPLTYKYAKRPSRLGRKSVRVSAGAGTNSKNHPGPRRPGEGSSDILDAIEPAPLQPR